MMVSTFGDFANIASKKAIVRNPTNGDFVTLNIDLTSYSGQTVFQIGREAVIGGNTVTIIYLDQVKVQEGETFKIRNLIGTGDLTYVRQISGNGSVLMRGFTYGNPLDQSYNRFGTLYNVNAGAQAFLTPPWAIGGTNDFALMDIHIFFTGKLGTTYPVVDVYLVPGTTKDPNKLVRKGIVLREGEYHVIRKLIVKRNETPIVTSTEGHVTLVYGGFSFPNK